MNEGDEKERVAEKRKRLQALFPQLREETQTYVLGLAEGIKVAQERAGGYRPYERRI